MSGSDEKTGSLFSDVDLEGRISAKHPLRMIRRIVNEALPGGFCQGNFDGGILTGGMRMSQRFAPTKADLRLPLVALSAHACYKSWSRSDQNVT